MPTFEEAIRALYPGVTSDDGVIVDPCVLDDKVTQSASEKLHSIATREGLGVAIVAAWRHGLMDGHIPLTLAALSGPPEDPRAKTLEGDGDCPYTFVYVPVRKYRSQPDKLIKLKIMNENADPEDFIYHEDGLVSLLSFPEPRPARLKDSGIADILEVLRKQAVLAPVNLNNRQIQFKDLSAKKRLQGSGSPVYVVNDLEDWDKRTLPRPFAGTKIKEYVERILKSRMACNYCSVHALNPREVTIHSTYVHTFAEERDAQLATVRNYQLGFTFAPIGDPERVCHFLAWDFPHINDVVMNMDPQVYSFSDLIKLVRVINKDISDFCTKHQVVDAPQPISGACNHWAGNTVYHQHYQFFRLSKLPLLEAGMAAGAPLATYKGVEVRRVAAGWQAPAYIIQPTGNALDEDVMHFADLVAREWRLLSEGEDLTYGNGISIKNHTQNIFVTTVEGRLTAVFIPRYRNKITTKKLGNDFQKVNVGVLEMLGYFVIDDPDHYELLNEKMSPYKRKKLADSWLTELAPDEDAIKSFQDNVKICFQDDVRTYGERIYKMAMSGDVPRAAVAGLASEILRDGELKSEQKEHLYRELLSTVLESTAADWEPVSRS